MASTGNKPINVHLDFASGAKLKNLVAATASGEAVEYNQLQTALAAKSDLAVGGSGIAVDGSTVSVDLSTAGASYDSVIISGAGFASLDGTYARLPFRGHLENFAPSMDYYHGTGDYAIYSKDNGGGVYALLAMCDTDGSNSPAGPTWLAVLVGQDPTGFTQNITDLASVIGVDYDIVANGSEIATNGDVVPSSADSNITYAAGSGESYLKFSSGQLAADVVTNMSLVATGKLVDSNTIKTYIDEQDVTSRAAATNTFSNSTANLTGAPTNVQSAIEAAASEIDSLDASVVTLTTVNNTQDGYIEDARLALGISLGADSLSAFTGGAAAFVGASGTVQGSLQTVGDSISTVYQNIGTINGLAAFETDFGTGFVILPNNSDAKSLFQATEAELQSLSLGLGQFWAPVEAHSDVNIDVSNPGTDTFGGAVVSTNDRVLLLGQTVPSENGVWVFATSGTAMSRATDADASDEFTPNKTVQVLNSTAEGISGATFAYSGAADPVIGTSSLTFTLKSQGVVGDNTITEGKLATALAATITAKADKYAETVTFVAGVPQNVSHGLASQDVIVQCRDTSGNVVELEVDITDSGFVTINSPIISGDFRVVVIG